LIKTIGLHANNPEGLPMVIPSGILTEFEYLRWMCYWEFFQVYFCML